MGAMVSGSAVSTMHGWRLQEVLMDQLAGVEIQELHDEYAALEQLVAAKATGQELEVPTEPEPAVDLMAALEASIRAAI
jgi:DNA end-binding protein Ku